MKKISVYLPEELIKKLNKAAEDKGIGTAVLLRMWIIEKAKDEGLLGQTRERERH